LKASSDGGTIIVPVGIWFQIYEAAKDKNTTSKVGFYYGNMQKRLARETQ